MWRASYVLVEGLTEQEKSSVELQASDQDTAAAEAQERATSFSGESNAIDLYQDGLKVTRLWVSV